MNGWAILRRARITLLCFLVLISLAWATLLAIFLSHEWSHSPLFQKILVVIFLSLYVFTAIFLYLMAVRPVCPWWDVAWMFAILVVHIGISVLFTHYRPSFPCSGYDTETACKGYVFMIFIGCWVFSGTTLCFGIALAVMAFIPRPVEPEVALESLPLADIEDNEVPLNPDRFKVGSPMDERRTSLSPIHIGLPVVTYNNLPGKSLSRDRDTSSANRSHMEVIMEPPPHIWESFQSQSSRNGNENRTRGGTISTRNAPGGSTSIGSVPQPADSFSQKFFSYYPTSRIPTHSRASVIRPAVGRKSPLAANVKPNSTFPRLPHDALSPPNPLRNSPSLVTVLRDRATEYPPTVFSARSSNLVLTPPRAVSQLTYPDHARTTPPDVYSSHPAPANVHSVVVEPPPYALHPSVPSPRFVRFQDLSTFGGPKNISSGNDASFAASGSSAPLMRNVSQPRRTVRRSGEGTVHHAGIPPVKEVPFMRRGSDEQVLDQTKWWGLVRNAATKP